MAALKRRVDDDAVFDDTLYDRRYYPRKVFKDGKGLRVPIALTDGMPDWMPPRRPLFEATPSSDNARHHRPRFADLTDARLQDGLKQAAEARQAYIARISDAWRTMGGGTGGAAHTTAPSADEPGENDDDLSPRDQYIARISNAWRTPPGQDVSDNPIEAQRRRWLSPGATPGNDAAHARPRSAPTAKDAAADRDAAYAEYVARISNGWRG